MNAAKPDFEGDDLSFSFFWISSVLMKIDCYKSRNCRRPSPCLLASLYIISSVDPEGLLQSQASHDILLFLVFLVFDLMKGKHCKHIQIQILCRLPSFPRFSSLNKIQVHEVSRSQTFSEMIKIFHLQLWISAFSMDTNCFMFKKIFSDRFSISVSTSYEFKSLWWCMLENKAFIWIHLAGNFWPTLTQPFDWIFVSPAYILVCEMYLIVGGRIEAPASISFSLSVSWCITWLTRSRCRWGLSLVK